MILSSTLSGSEADVRIASTGMKAARWEPHARKSEPATAIPAAARYHRRQARPPRLALPGDRVLLRFGRATASPLTKYRFDFTRFFPELSNPGLSRSKSVASCNAEKASSCRPSLERMLARLFGATPYSQSEIAEANPLVDAQPEDGAEPRMVAAARTLVQRSFTLRAARRPALPLAFAIHREPRFAVGQVACLAAARDSEGVTP